LIDRSPLSTGNCAISVYGVAEALSERGYPCRLGKWIVESF
jgi:hypothetical protein